MYPSGTQVDANGFIIGQNRDLDPQTVDWFCGSCPYKGIKPQQRGNDASRSTSTANFGSVGEDYAVHRLKTRYVCTSPKQTFVQSQTQEHSTIGFSFCPFLEQKLALLYDRSSEE